MTTNSLIQDILNASIVFAGVELMNRQDAQSALGGVANTEVVGMDVGFSVTAGGTPEPTRRLTLQRDRISLDIASTRSTVSMEYPPRDFSLLSRVICCAVESTNLQGQELTAHGYNMTLVLAPELTRPAVEYIGDHLFESRNFGRDEWELAGGLGTLYFDEGDRRWTFNIEPRPRNDMRSRKLFMSVNLHVLGDNMPTDHDVIGGTFREVLSAVEYFASQFIRAGE